jgi:hypothetical protein
VTARPTMRGHCHCGRTPQVAPLSVKLSSASETAQVSSLDKRSMISSRAIKASFLCCSDWRSIAADPKLETGDPRLETRHIQ